MKYLNFSYRKWFFFGKNHNRKIQIEICGITQLPHISFRVDGGDGEVQFHLALLLGVWITFQNFIPNSWYPQRKSSYNSEPLPDERALKIYWFEWAIWWNLWMPEDEWNSTDPKWRRGSIHFDRLLMGKHSCEWQNLDGGKFVLPFFEGVYEVEVIKKLRIDSFTRWFTRKSISFEVKCDAGVPHEGKGENSYDQGEDCTFAINFPGSRTKTNTLYQAALYFWHSCMETRERYGSARWVPRAYSGTPLNVIKPKAK